MVARWVAKYAEAQRSYRCSVAENHPPIFSTCPRVRNEDEKATNAVVTAGKNPKRIAMLTDSTETSTGDATLAREWAFRFGWFGAVSGLFEGAMRMKLELLATDNTPRPTANDSLRLSAYALRVFAPRAGNGSAGFATNGRVCGQVCSLRDPAVCWHWRRNSYARPLVRNSHCAQFAPLVPFNIRGLIYRANDTSPFLHAVGYVVSLFLLVR